METTRLLPILSSLSLVAACAVNDAGAPVPTEDDGYGAMLTLDILSGRDVAGFEFTTTRCNGVEVVDQHLAYLQNSLAPGGVAIMQTVLDEQSAHLFADRFLALEFDEDDATQNCYEVSARPFSGLDADENPVWSNECSSAQTDPLNPIQLMRGTTVEVEPLISQCVGDTEGAFDVPIVVNHPPRVHVYIEDKFGGQCENITVCAIAWDDDNDPIEWNWEVAAGDIWLQDPWIVNAFARVYSGSPAESTELDNGVLYVTQCREFAMNAFGGYTGSVAVYDLSAGGDRFETLVQDYPAPFNESHDDLEFPLYVQPAWQLQCVDDQGALQDIPTTPAYAPNNECLTDCYNSLLLDQDYYYCNAAYGGHFNFDTTLTCPGGAWDPTATEVDCADVPETCGNGIVEPGEACDLAEDNGVAGSGCDIVCQLVP
ncbi:MAG: hypothetical protein V3V08_12155 [Nannocystaceae bacterium]